MVASTAIPRMCPVVLVVGGRTDLLIAVATASSALLSARVMKVSLAGLAKAASEHPPIAIVLPEVVYKLEAVEFDALARNVTATIVMLDYSLQRDALERKLRLKFGELIRDRNR